MSADTAAPTPGLSQIERVVDTFVAPSKTFADIRRNTTWWLPFLIMLIGSLSVGYSVQHEVTFERAYMNQVRNSPSQEDRINQMDPEARTKMISVSSGVTKYITYLFAVLVAAVLAIYSLILWASFNFGLGAETTFWQVYAVSWYAMLPYILRSALTIFTLHFGGNAEGYDSTNPVGTNLAYFMTDTGPAIKALLSGLDIIRLWSVGLQVLGMAIIAKKKIAPSAFIVVGIYLVLVLVTVGIAAAFS